MVLPTCSAVAISTLLPLFGRSIKNLKNNKFCSTSTTCYLVWDGRYIPMYRVTTYPGSWRIHNVCIQGYTPMAYGVMCWLAGGRTSRASLLSVYIHGVVTVGAYTWWRYCQCIYMGGCTSMMCWDGEDGYTTPCCGPWRPLHGAIQGYTPTAWNEWGA